MNNSVPLHTVCLFNLMAGMQLKHLEFIIKDGSLQDTTILLGRYTMNVLHLIAGHL